MARAPLAVRILTSLGKEHVGKVIALWDSLGVRGCLNVEREEVITEFTKLRAALESLKIFPRCAIEDIATKL